MVVQLVKKFLTFHGTYGFPHCSQEPAISPVILTCCS